MCVEALQPHDGCARELVTMTSLQTTPREPPFPRAAEIDECVADASSRVKRLHGLLTQWQLADMSQEQSSHLLAYVEEVLQHTRESSSALAAYDETIQQSLGPELCQARTSGIPLCSTTPPCQELAPSPPRPQNLFWDLLDPVAAAPYSAHAFQRQQLPEIERRCAQLRVRAVAPVVGKPVEALEHGVERAIGHCTERGFEIQLVRIPRHGVPWGACCRHLAAMEAARELALSRHFATFLGVERAPGARCDEYRRELLGGPSLAAVLRAHGPLPEASMLFTHWRRELLEALLHLSSHCTFLLRRTVALEHVRPVEQGGRLVLTDLEWGAEFPEGAVEPLPAAAAAAAAEPPRRPLGLQEQRDELLLHDGVRMLLLLLGPPEQPAGEPPSLSPQLRAICAACAGGDTPPSLRQTLSHPYFTPLQGAQRHDVQLAFQHYIAQHYIA
jgi:G:T/U-mismatch repair DNA glycosylase